MASGPHGEPQPKVKHCPWCGAGELVNVPSRNQPVPRSHHYECPRCKQKFEINEM
jgi:transposase-like protein